MRTITEIVQDMTAAKLNYDDERFNELAWELAERLWTPNIGLSFQQLAEGFGYVDTNNRFVKRRSLNEEINKSKGN